MIFLLICQFIRIIQAQNFTCDQFYKGEATCKTLANCTASHGVALAPSQLCPASQRCCHRKLSASECAPLDCITCRLNVDFGCTYCEGQDLCLGKGLLCPDGTDPNGLLFWTCNLPTSATQTKTTLSAHTTRLTTQPTTPSRITTQTRTPTVTRTVSTASSSMLPVVTQSSLSSSSLSLTTSTSMTTLHSNSLACSARSIAAGSGLFPLPNARNISATRQPRSFAIGTRDANNQPTSPPITPNVSVSVLLPASHSSSSFVPIANDANLLRVVSVVSVGQQINVTFVSPIRSTFALRIRFFNNETMSLPPSCDADLRNSPVVILGVCLQTCDDDAVCIADVNDVEQCLTVNALVKSTTTTMTKTTLTTTTAAITDSDSSAVNTIDTTDVKPTTTTTADTTPIPSTTTTTTTTTTTLTDTAQQTLETTLDLPTTTQESIISASEAMTPKNNVAKMQMSIAAMIVCIAMMVIMMVV